MLKLIIAATADYTAIAANKHGSLKWKWQWWAEKTREKLKAHWHW